MKKTLTLASLASLASISVASAALTNISSSDDTYIRSNDADTNFNSSTTNVANDNGSNHRIAYYTYDLSALIADNITSVTWSLTQNAGGTTDEYEVFGQAATIDLTTMTWNNAGAALSSNRPTGTSLGTFIGTAADSSYDVTLSAAFFDADADGLITLAIVDNNSDNGGIGWADGPTLNVTYTAVPEPSSAALLGLGGLTLILHRKK